MGTMMVTVENCNHGNVSFKCVTSEGCINLTLLCDGVNHCLDGSDESFTHARCYDVYKSSPSTALIELIAIILGCLVALAVLCCVLGTIVECARHIYKYWCPKRLHVALQRRRTQPINRFSSRSRVDRSAGNLPIESRDQRPRPLETSLVYSPRLRTIDYTRACLPVGQGSAQIEGGLMMNRSTAVVMYLNQLPPQYSAVVLSPTSDQSATRTTVLSQASPHVNNHQQQQLLWLKQQQQQRLQQVKVQNSAQTNPEANKPCNDISTQSTDKKLKTNSPQTTGCPERKTDARQRCAAAKLASSSGDLQSRDSDLVANDYSITFSNFHRPQSTAAAKRRVDVADATTSTTIDDIIMDDNRSIYCTRAALENLLKTGNYIACHVIPSCVETSAVKEAAYSKVDITENLYQVVKSDYSFSGQKDKSCKVGTADNVLNLNEFQSYKVERVAIDDDDDDDNYDKADYQQMKSHNFEKHSLDRRESQGEGVERARCGPPRLDTLTSLISSHPPHPHCNPGLTDPLRNSTRIVTAQTIPNSSNIPEPPVNITSGVHSPPITNLSPLISPQNSYPIVLIQALSPVMPTNQIDSLFDQSDMRDLLAFRLNQSDLTNDDGGSTKPPSYSTVNRSNQRRD